MASDESNNPVSTSTKTTTTTSNINTTEPTDPTITKPSQPKTPSKKRKRKHKPSKSHVLTQLTLSNPSWTYMHLQHISIDSNPSSVPLDAPTIHLNLTSALRQFFGLHGAAIRYDILDIRDQDVWLRLREEDRRAFVAAVGGWVGKGGGWRMKGWSSWDAGVRALGNGQALFGD